MKIQCCICKKLSHDVEVGEYVSDWVKVFGLIYCPEHDPDKK